MSNVLSEENKHRRTSRNGRRLPEGGRDWSGLPGAWGRRAPAKPAIGVTPDSVGPFSEKQGSPRDTLSTSSCEPYRELIERGLAQVLRFMATAA